MDPDCMMKPEAMQPGMLKPRLLLVEDDPVSRSFLGSAAEAIPAEVDAVDSIAAAIACAADRAHDLWLFDANLPDGSGIELLQQLRVAYPATPALAHTATRDRACLDALVAAGFSEALIKPLGTREWQAAIRRALGTTIEPAMQTTQHCGKLPVWDNENALAALNGNREHVTTLRGLFLADLRAQHDAVLAALQRQDHAEARDVLHQLKASCGFVGAARLQAAVEALDAAPSDPVHAENFSHAMEDTLAAN